MQPEQSVAFVREKTKAIATHLGATLELLAAMAEGLYDGVYIPTIDDVAQHERLQQVASAIDACTRALLAHQLIHSRRVLDKSFPPPGGEAQLEKMAGELLRHADVANKRQRGTDEQIKVVHVVVDK